MKRLTLVFDFEDDDYEELLKREDVDYKLGDWVFGEFCQNQDFGFLSSLHVEKIED